jgi:hypothetical protein
LPALRLCGCVRFAQRWRLLGSRLLIQVGHV